MPGGTQGLVSGPGCRAVLFPGSAILADRDDRDGTVVDDGSMTSAGVILPSAVTVPISSPAGIWSSNSGKTGLSPSLLG